MKFNYKTVILMLTGMLLTGCQKYLDISAPSNQLLLSGAFSADNTASSAVNGMYSTLNTAAGQGRGSDALFGGAWTDEISAILSGNPYYLNSMAANDGLSGSVWTSDYNLIYQANAIIEGLQSSSAVSAAAKNQFTGEAKFVRALCHFYLINFYGDVPLLLTTNIQVTATASRTPSAQVYEQIIADLTDAQKLMVGDYSYAAGEHTRANKWAAEALLSRVYLYTGNYAAAEKAATEVIQSGNFSLLTDLNAVFIKNSAESILQINTAPNNYTTIALNLLPSPLASPPAIYALSGTVISAFEPGDARKVNWTIPYSYLNVNYLIPSKYKQRTVNSLASGEYYTLLRLAELFLIRSEARLQNGDLNGAITDLNRIRSRAGLAGTVANDKPSLLLAIEHERQVELFTERDRWIDLKRTGRLNTVLTADKPTWKPTCALWPIPLSNIQTDPNLTQNPGY